MTTYIDTDLANLVKKLSDLRIATPESNPNYSSITEQYREASKEQTEAIDKAIDNADVDYKDFSDCMQPAIDAINKALDDIKQVATAITMVAKVIDVAGKIISKV